MLLNRMASVLVALVCAAVLCCAGCRDGKLHPSPRTPVPPQPRPNILFITVDALRADYTGCIGGKPFTSAMDEVSDMGVLFSRCISSTSVTGPSISAMMTGSMPHRINYQFNAMPLDPRLFTLAEILNFAGYDTAGFPGTSLLSSDYGFQQGFDFFDNDFDRSEYASNYWKPGEIMTDSVIRWIDNRKSRKPFFAWIHYFDPHDPYIAHYGERAGQEYTYEFLNDLYIRQDPGLVRAELEGILEFYSQEVFYTDRQIARVLKHLRDKSLLSNTLVVITADHGEELFQHDLFYGHGRSLNHAVLHVPLIIMFPGKKYSGTRVDTVVRTIDIFPTILEQAGQRAPRSSQGRSLMPLITGAERAPRPAFSTREPLSFYKNGRAAALTEAEWKFIYFENEPGRLYNLKIDPMEFENVADSHPAVVKRMRALTLKNTLEDSGYIPPVEPEFDGRDYRMLKSLGYLK